MNRYVKIEFNGNVLPDWFHYVDENYVWTEEQIISENAKSVEIAKLAFFDHGVPLIPLDSIDTVLNQKAAYLNSAKDVVFLIREGGQYMPLIPQMEITEETRSAYFPIKKGAAILCENDPFATSYAVPEDFLKRWCDANNVDSFHIMWNFRSRTEAEIIDAFKNTPAILAYSTYTAVDWWELMLRCIIKSKTKAKIVAFPCSNRDRYDKFIELAKKFDVHITEY